VDPAHPFYGCAQDSKCCGNTCIPLSHCCRPDGTAYQCPSWMDCCPGMASGCMPHGYKCCGNHPCPPYGECCDDGCMPMGKQCCYPDSNPGAGFPRYCEIGQTCRHGGCDDP
jgi:hypothetical protein